MIYGVSLNPPEGVIHRGQNVRENVLEVIRMVKCMVRVSMRHTRWHKKTP
jgi:hypothetical protein